MVLYGTETSLEIDEELDKDKPVPSPADPEIIQENVAVYAGRPNVVDTEGDPWTGSQQVDLISHPEVQRPTTENQTSGACTRYDSHGCLGGCLILIIVLFSLSKQIDSCNEIIASFASINYKNSMGDTSLEFLTRSKSSNNSRCCYDEHLQISRTLEICPTSS